jgi:hypothetical protein
MKHGRSAFVNGKCRCDVCRQAQADYMREYRGTPIGKRKHAINARKKAKRDALCREWVKSMQPDVYQHIWKVVESGS